MVISARLEGTLTYLSNKTQYYLVCDALVWTVA